MKKKGSSFNYLVVIITFMAIFSFNSVPVINAEGALITWTKNDELDMDYYLVYHRVLGENYNEPPILVEYYKDFYNFENLDPGTHFFCVVAGDTSGNESEASEEVSKIIEEEAAAYPAVTGLTVDLSGSMATFNWSAIPEAASYLLYFWPSTAEFSPQTAIFATENHSEGMVPSSMVGAYIFAVKAKYADGELSTNLSNQVPE